MTDEIVWTFSPEDHASECGCVRMATAVWDDDNVRVWNDETGEEVSIPWWVIYLLAERDGAI